MKRENTRRRDVTSQELQEFRGGISASASVSVSTARGDITSKSERGTGQISRVLDEKLGSVTQELRTQKSGVQEFRSSGERPQTALNAKRSGTPSQKTSSMSRKSNVNGALSLLTLALVPPPGLAAAFLVFLAEI